MAPGGLGKKAEGEQLLNCRCVPSPENLGMTGLEKCHQTSKGLITKLSGRVRTRYKLAPVSPLLIGKWSCVQGASA